MSRSNKNFCSNCGYENDEGARFCISCGAALGEHPSSTSDPLYRSSAREGYAFPSSDIQPAEKGQRGLIIGLLLGIIAAIVIIAAVLIMLLVHSDSDTAGIEPTHSADYHPHADYSALDTSKLEYGDEETIKDFSYTDGWSTLSDTASRVTDFEDTVGFWKAVMISDPDNETDEGKSIDYFNVEISGSTDEVYLIFNWRRRVTESTGEVLELKGNTGYSGIFSDGVISAENTGKVTITDFWSENGTQYAVGTYIWPDGSKGYIGLTRKDK